MCKAREDFLQRYAECMVEGYMFDSEKKAIDYCNSDIDILRRGYLELRKQFFLRVPVLSLSITST